MCKPQKPRYYFAKRNWTVQAHLNLCINRSRQFELLPGKPSYQKLSPVKLNAPGWEEPMVLSAKKPWGLVPSTIGAALILRTQFSLGWPGPEPEYVSHSCFQDTPFVNFQTFKLVLEKVEEAETKLPTSAGSSKKQESSRKTSTSASLTLPKPLTVWITTNCGKFFKTWEYQTTWCAAWEISMQVRSNR